MNVRITTLAENTASWIGLLGEWGLSILVEVDGLRVLLDTGATDTVVHNASSLDVDLSSVDKIVLSHGHYDHTGGLRSVLRAMKGTVQVISHPDIWDVKYALLQGEDKHRYIGIPFKREELEWLGASFAPSREPVWITDSIVTTGEIPLRNDYEQIDPVLQIKSDRGGQRFVGDPLHDDLSLVIKDDGGLIVISGCAHKGIINTIHRAREITGVEKVKAVIGGTHLMNASDERLEWTITELKKLELEHLGVSHCTGFHAASRMAGEFGDIFFSNNAGTQKAL
ncbi:MAG: MBL fold metallo-hydrolase [Dehalococcoidia bacterium]|nr:MBL fold metallo-hydrolase [Dehalococcoidia bacterium]